MKKTIMNKKSVVTQEPVAPVASKAAEKVVGKVAPVAPTPKATKATKVAAVAPVFTPDARLQGISITAASLLFQIATVLQDDYPKVPEVAAMADRISALSDAFRAWGDGE